jgi:hypothetical protein
MATDDFFCARLDTMIDMRHAHAVGADRGIAGTHKDRAGSVVKGDYGADFSWANEVSGRLSRDRGSNSPRQSGVTWEIGLIRGQSVGQNQECFATFEALHSEFKSLVAELLDSKIQEAS